ncbi:hypothetical protein T12_1403 [Trichinella patagoniensis]|uniref:Uncharacterized protein n=1 Tax=Trichinella patagoniensis TaxID=990121 RepID=A0A0V0YRB3_9BILA|nr:hypothetical protein T12_1403 [Trichinella patagoniensis]
MINRYNFSVADRETLPFKGVQFTKTDRCGIQEI